MSTIVNKINKPFFLKK